MDKLRFGNSVLRLDSAVKVSRYQEYAYAHILVSEDLLKLSIRGGENLTRISTQQKMKGKKTVKARCWEMAGKWKDDLLGLMQTKRQNTTDFSLCFIFMEEKAAKWRE